MEAAADTQQAMTCRKYGWSASTQQLLYANEQTPAEHHQHHDDDHHHHDQQQQQQPSEDVAECSAGHVEGPPRHKRYSLYQHAVWNNSLFHPLASWGGQEGQLLPPKFWAVGKMFSCWKIVIQKV